ncbi:MAG: ABC transporter permease [Candidatus Micrarchaeia archaeon]
MVKDIMFKNNIILNKSKRLSKILSSMFLYPEIASLISLIVVIMTFASLNPSFLTFPVITGILSIASELGIMSMGVALLMIAGEFNLAVSSISILHPIIIIFLSNIGISPLLAFIFSLLIIAGIGISIGIIKVFLNIHSFIVTLAFMFTLRCILLYITGGVVQKYKSDEYLLTILNGRLIGDFRFSILWILIFTIILEVLLKRTKFGNWCYAVGGNPHIARELGVKTDYVKIINFMLSSIFAGLTGCFILGRMGVIDPSVGYGLELESIAAALIGGCSLFGGFGSITGVFFGSLTLSTFRIGLVYAGAPLYWYETFVGILLIIAAIINYFTMKKILLYK